MPLSPGTRLGPYEVLSPIGAGGMGDVYRARDARLGRDVAIKVLPDELARDHERLRRFETEARAVGALNHPNILAVYDTGGGEAPFVVFELLEGETLRKRLERRALPVRKALEYAVQIARGLAAAHERGIVHRDLKPENLFLTQDGRVKILDFGLARVRPDQEVTESQITEALTEAGTLLGTVSYMSPEQVHGRAVDHRSDIFSFGSVLYEMLSGSRPFRGASKVETMNAILREDPAELSGTGRVIPAGLERIVRRCLEKEPGERFRSAHDLAYALEAVSGSSPALAAPAARPRRRFVPVLVAALLLALPILSYLAGRAGRKAVIPSFERLTYRRGTVWGARFAPDGETVVYGAAWEGAPIRLFSTRVENPESVPLKLPDADLLSISRTGELAVSLGRRSAGLWDWQGGPRAGTLATAPLAGEAVRERLRDVLYADWSPDGTELAVVRQVGEKLRLEFPIGKVLYEAPAGASLMHVRISPDGRQVALWVAGEVKGQTAAIMAFDRSGRATTLAEDEANSLAWSPGGDEVWYALGGEVKAVDLRGRRRVITRLPGRAAISDIAPDGRALVTLGQLHGGLAASRSAEASERDLSWLGGSVIAGLSVDGETLLFSEMSGRGSATFVRKTDGKSPAVKLRGDCFAQALSPDGAWAIVEDSRNPLHLVLVPTGAGESRSLDTEGLKCAEPVCFFPDGKRALVTCRTPGPAPRAYVVDIEGGKPRPITPEGTACNAISPDGREAACADASNKWFIYPTEGGTPRPLPVIGEQELVLQWSADGHSLFVYGLFELPQRIFLVDALSGRRQLWKAIGPSDPAGVDWILPVITRDGRSYAYNYRRNLSELWMVGGLAR